MKGKERKEKEKRVTYICIHLIFKAALSFESGVGQRVGEPRDK